MRYPEGMNFNLARGQAEHTELFITDSTQINTAFPKRARRFAPCAQLGVLDTVNSPNIVCAIGLCLRPQMR